MHTLLPSDGCAVHTRYLSASVSLSLSISGSQPHCLSASLSLSLSISQPHCLSASLTLRLSASLSLSLSISQPLSLSTSLSLSLSAGAVVGCAFFDPPSELLPEVVRQAGTQVFSIVAVQPELRGRGVGT